MTIAIGFEAMRTDPQARWSPIEKELGHSFVDNEDDKYGLNRGKEVIVRLPGSSYAGVYQGTTSAGGVILLPHIIVDNLPGNLTRTRLDFENPEIIERSAIVSMGAVPEGYCSEYVQRARQREDQKEDSLFDYSI